MYFLLPEKKVIAAQSGYYFFPHFHGSFAISEDEFEANTFLSNISFCIINVTFCSSMGLDFLFVCLLFKSGFSV